MNWQHCRNVVFVGLSYSFEDFYQALRRSYRFGQTRQVNAYIAQASTEGAITRAIEKKIEQHQQMQERMKVAALAFRNNTTKKLTMKTDINTATGDGWQIHHGDCVRVAQQIEDQSIDFSVFSPPFADLFTYSDDLQDMGNCANLDEFTKHFEILIAEIARIMKPGREVAVHCVDLLSTKWKHGKIEFQDFSGEIVRMFWKHDFAFHSRICIWKSPVTEMQRTKAHGLLYKTLKADSTDSRVGCADYLLVFRAPGENLVPVTKDPAKYRQPIPRGRQRHSATSKIMITTPEAQQQGGSPLGSGTCSLSLWTAARGETRTYAWGASTRIVDGKIEEDFEGVSFEYYMPFIGGSGPTIVGRSASCLGCPHLALRSGWKHCAHPLYVKMYDCPQSMGSAKEGLHADRDCPMLGMKSERAQKRYRQKEKARNIFWEYYHEAGINPYRQGFTIPRFHV